ncbi:ATP-binding protein [Salinicola peritrichatus]|uniref:ATP-binding protein n=1 Tax=Salinicola peritrichatus TaxID=1267424 RepID=UPI000DA26057|nr:ATP-binding protein [Salinicola peritrichatus]
MTETSIMGVLETRAAHCDQHGDYESLLLNVGGKRWTGCPQCSQAAIDRAEAEREQNQVVDLRSQRGQAMFEQSGIPARLREATLKNYVSAGDSQQRAHKQVCEYARHLPERLGDGNGLILMGNMGTGKTHLAVGLIRHCTRNLAVAAKYTTAPALFSRIRASYNSHTETEAKILAELIAAPLLVLDEIGVGKGSDNELNVTYSLLGQRYDERRPTIVITNLMSEEFKAWLGERVVDRMRETNPVVLFDWESHRGRS